MADGRSAGNTNATRLLDARGMAYERLEYDSSIVTGAGVAEVFGVPANAVLKTLVLRTDAHAIVLLMTPSDGEVDLRRLATGIGARKVAMVSKADAEALTGMQTGGISALALTAKKFSVYLDHRAMQHPRVYVNGGRRGLNVCLSPDDLLTASGAVPVSFTLESATAGDDPDTVS